MALMCFIGGAEAEEPIVAVPWTTGDLATIKSMCDNDNINVADYWEIGQQRSVTYTTSTFGDTTRNWVLTDFNGTTSGGTPYNAVIHTKEISTSTLAMNTSRTNAGGWRDSNMRATYMPQCYNALPTDFKALIKQASIVSGAGNQSDTIQTTQDFIFLFSERNVQGAKTYSGQQEYNACKQMKYFETASNKTKTGGPYSYWWLRSPSVSNATHFCSVYSNGYAGNYSADNSTDCGVVPAAII